MVKKKPPKKTVVKQRRERAITKKGYERKIGRKVKAPVMHWDDGTRVTKSEKRQDR